MDDDDIYLIESIASEVMTRLGYKPHIVGITKDALVFSDEQIADFKTLNEAGIKKMHADLAVENPEDLKKRRLIQKAVLEREAVMLSTKDKEKDKDLDEDDEDDEDDKVKVCILKVFVWLLFY